MRRTTAVVGMVLAFALTAMAHDGVLEDDLAALQGKWATQLGTHEGKALRAIKEVRGNTETYSLFLDSQVVQKREVTFRLSRLENKVRVFTITRFFPVIGPEAGRTFATEQSYLYKIEGDSFIEVSGLLVAGNLEGSPTQLLRWQRVSRRPGSGDDAETVRYNTLRLQSLGPGAIGRDIVKLQAYDFLGSPSCSRDGRWVSFDAYKIASGEHFSHAECYIVRLDGTGLLKLASGATPCWSPDGERLLFMRQDGGDPDREVSLWLINRDGTGEHRIGPGRWPDWSPDGAHIAYSLGGPARGGARPQAQVHVARADGSEGRVVGDGDCPSWSPDGRRIACCYVDPAGDRAEIRAVDVESGERVTLGPGWSRPSWSPDGKSVVCDGRAGTREAMVKLSAEVPGQPPEPLFPGTEPGSSPCHSPADRTVVFVQPRPRVERGGPPHTADGRYDIATIDLTVVYLVPRDRKPLLDWRERVDYFMGRIAAFHRRESGGRSSLRIQVHPEPVVAGRTSEEIRGDNPDRTFENSTLEARSALGWPQRREGFPILLVLSEINWRELDDFQRLTTGDGEPRFDGAVDRDGRHFPGAKSGGARATYLPDEGIGLGLVSADGWRVPYSGSDCVIYHEGVGHPVGLMHPEPMDDSVMGAGQYRYWISQSWLDSVQKQALGFPDRRETGGSAPRDLFTAFVALPSPAVPKPLDPVQLQFQWPEGARLKELKLRIETDVHGPWRSVAVDTADAPPRAVDLGTFARPTPVSYRVDATLHDGQTVELWGYFQVKE